MRNHEKIFHYPILNDDSSLMGFDASGPDIAIPRAADIAGSSKQVCG
jgi:hypothetical protein